MAKSLLDNKNVRTPSEDYLSYLIELSEQERKDVYQEVMKDRTDRLSDRLENQTLGQILGGGINLSERIISGLSGSGFDKIPVFKGTSEEKAFIKAAKDILDNREIKSEGGLLGDQRKIDVNKDGEITAKDFEMLREQRQSGGLLDDDMMRVGYANGNVVGPEEREVDFGMRDDYVNREILTGIVNESKMIGKYKDKEKYSNPEKLEAHLNKYMDKVEKNTQYAGNLNREAMMDEFMKELKLYGVGREQKAEGGEMEMLPDEEMEQNFVDFVVDEALSPEEKSMLEEQLEANPQLSVLFDKVVETASEFTGAGPVEGPGTGTSDDIPARLSDGEFVFTAKAVEQLGADNLMKMMKDAEAAYDAGGEREAMQEGGLTSVEEEQENPMAPKKVEVEYTINRPAANVVSGVNPLLAAQEEQDLIDEELKKRMIGITPYVRS